MGHFLAVVARNRAARAALLAGVALGAYGVPAPRVNVVQILAHDMGYADAVVTGGRNLDSNIDGSRQKASDSRKPTMPRQYARHREWESPLDSSRRGSISTRTSTLVGGNESCKSTITWIPRYPRLLEHFNRPATRPSTSGGGIWAEAATWGTRRCQRNMVSMNRTLHSKGSAIGCCRRGKLSELNEKLGRAKISHAPQAELTEIYVNRSIDFIKRPGAAGKPFYIHLWPNEVQDPSVPKADLMKKYERFVANKYVQQYYAMLDNMDQQIGRLIDTIEQMGQAQNTFFVFLSDNGPTAWPH